MKGGVDMKYKPLPIGIDDFEELITRGAYYVDKTRLIEKIIDNTTKVTLFTRPRRFGKSLNLSMLQAYFENDGVDRAHLFEELKIADAGEIYQKELGRYPVVMLNFKDGKWPTFEQSYEMIRYNIAREFDRHSKILQSEMLDEVEKKEFRRIRSGEADINAYSQSIAFLCACLEKVYGEKAVILIDEYDVPIENAYFRGFYDEMISFIRGMLSLALKTNKSLAFAVITGCLRISKESIFTGLNNLQIVSIQDRNYGEFFGFTSEEVYEMLVHYDKPHLMEKIKAWYDGYVFGVTEVYNPWSLLNHMTQLRADENAFPLPYWSNTSSNSIIKDLIVRADWETKAELEKLIQGGSIEKSIHEDITYEDIYKDNDNLWNFLYFTGYLKKVNQRMDEEQVVLTLEIPNLEVKSVYRRQIMEWVKEQIGQKDMTKLYEATLSGDIQAIEAELKRAMMETISYHDYNVSYYHGFIAALYKGMTEYRVQSKVECGLGRPDLLISYPIPDGKAVIFEFKITKEFSQLEEKAAEALRQIEEKKYIEGMQARGYTAILVYGVAFFGKTCKIKCL